MKHEIASEPYTEEPWSLSSLLYLAAFVSTLADALLPHLNIDGLANILMLAFVAVEYRNTLFVPKVMAAILVIVGLLAASATGTVLDSVWQGISRTRIFLVLFGAVAWLQVPARESPSLLAIREMVLTQPPGRRFAFVGAAAHGLGMAFNLAGISLLSGMISHSQPPLLRRRLGRAMAQGFAVVTCWSPFFVGAVVILAAWPQVTWLDVAPWGIGLAIVLWGLSWSMDRLMNPRSVTSTAQYAPTRVSPRAWLNTVTVLGILFAGTITIVELTSMSIPIALGIVAPPLAIVWRSLFSSPSARLRNSLDFASSSVRGLKNLRGEIVVFSAANIMGVGIAGLVDPGGITTLISGLELPVVGLLLLLALGYVSLGALGIHPIITIVLLQQFLTPELLGISGPIMVLTLMTLWGLGTNMSPVSATVLYISRLTRETNLTVAWRWNGPFSFTAAIATALLATAAQYLGLMQ